MYLVNACNELHDAGMHWIMREMGRESGERERLYDDVQCTIWDSFMCVTLIHASSSVTICLTLAKSRDMIWINYLIKKAAGYGDQQSSTCHLQGNMWREHLAACTLYLLCVACTAEDRHWSDGETSSLMYLENLISKYTSGTALSRGGFLAMYASLQVKDLAPDHVEHGHDEAQWCQQMFLNSSCTDKVGTHTKVNYLRSENSFCLIVLFG